MRGPRLNASVDLEDLVPDILTMIEKARQKMHDNPFEPEAVEPPTEPEPAQAEGGLAPGASMLLALQSHAHIYAGTVPSGEVERRRRKNRNARNARKGNTAAIAKQARRNKARNNYRRFGMYTPDPLGLREVEE